MVGVIGIFFLSIFLWMKSYTRHGESLQVEDYKEMHISDAMKKAKARRFEVVVLDSIYVPGRKEANVVLQQNPPAFARVKKHRTIYLTVTRGEGDPVALPRLTGREELSQYQRALNALDIKLRVKERVYNQKYAENTILKLIVNGQEIAAEELRETVKVLPGSTIEAVVTERGNQQIAVPNLICEQYQDAIFKIQNAQLSVGTEQADGTVTSKLDAYVYRQIPTYAPGKTMRIGDEVAIYLQQDRPSSCEEDNDQ